MSEPEIQDENLEKIEQEFHERTLRERLGVLFTGLRQPRGTREYKEALIELQRLAAPLAAIIIPLIFVAILIVASQSSGKDKTLQKLQIAEAQEEEELQEQQQEDVQQDQDLDQVDVTDVMVDSINTTVNVQNPAQTVSSAQTPTVTSVEAVSSITSPVKMKSVFGQTRSAAGRKAGLAKYGGDALTEQAVMNALRWLKVKQKADGSWDGAAGADGLRPTGLAVLTFLSHGEKPGASKEFGNTVQKACEYLMRAGGFDAAAIHALAEAYGLTRNPNIKTAVHKQLEGLADRRADVLWGPGRDGLVNGKHETRPRLLPMTFETMALRSAKLSHFKIANMDKALLKLKEGFLIQCNLRDGGFSDDYYGAPNRNYRRTGIWHSMVGVVAMQYLGQVNHPVVEKTLKILDDDWLPPSLETTDIACCPVRGNYWATMVFFNAGGKRWLKWNRDMKKCYVGGQHIVKDANYTDDKGKMQDIGYWTCEDMHISGNKVGMEVITTCYVAQQLMVYYRYLPTSSKEAWNAQDDQEEAVAADKNDVSVGVDDL